MVLVVVVVVVPGHGYTIWLAASAWARMFAPRVVRFPDVRHVFALQVPLPVSLVMAALYFCNADLPFTGSFSSHTFSSKSLAPKSESANLMWHLMTAATSLPSSEPTALAHLRRLASLTGSPVDIVPASSPPAPAGSIDVVPSQ